MCVWGARCAYRLLDAITNAKGFCDRAIRMKYELDNLIAAGVNETTPSSPPPSDTQSMDAHAATDGFALNQLHILICVYLGCLAAYGFMYNIDINNRRRRSADRTGRASACHAALDTTTISAYICAAYTYMFPAHMRDVYKNWRRLLRDASVIACARSSDEKCWSECSVHVPLPNGGSTSIIDYIYIRYCIYGFSDFFLCQHFCFGLEWFLSYSFIQSIRRKKKPISRIDITTALDWLSSSQQPGPLVYHFIHMQRKWLVLFQYICRYVFCLYSLWIQNVPSCLVCTGRAVSDWWWVNMEQCIAASTCLAHSRQAWCIGRKVSLNCGDVGVVCTYMCRGFVMLTLPSQWMRF